MASKVRETVFKQNAKPICGGKKGIAKPDELIRVQSYVNHGLLLLNGLDQHEMTQLNNQYKRC